ncbi:hypothetical protein [Tomitella cavernea]|uniref:Peptidase MA-like domain-containing protein n=1 Tax=Tomitella cavernea TaxID=1387982 RepID=A0ABP9CZD3_9ACTN|nr:hypothetical protein [Tomitella cavernea]
MSSTTRAEESSTTRAEESSTTRAEESSTTRAWGARLAKAAVALSAAAVVLLGGCASGDGQEPPGDAAATSEQLSPFQRERHDSVDALLASWATALQDDDEDALRGLIDAHAAPGFLESQLELARNLATVDFADFGFHIGDDPEVFVPAPIAKRLGAIDSWGPPVYLDFRIEGVDEAMIHTPVGLITARHGDHWTLVSTRELQDGTHATLPAGPWGYGPVTQTPVHIDGAGGSLVLSHPADGAEADRVREMLPGAVAAVSDFWGTQWDRTMVVEIADSADEFSGLTGNPAGRTDVAAATISLDSDTPGHGQRIVFAPGALSRMPADDAHMVLQHELAHAAVRTHVGRGAPTWLLEGTADYVAQRPVGGAPPPAPVPLVAAMVSAHGAPDELPQNKDFTGANAALAYELARSAADYIVATYGEDGLRAVHKALGAGGLDPAAQDEALNKAIGVTMNEFAGGWSQWLGGRFG